MKWIDTFRVFGTDNIDPDQTVINIPSRPTDHAAAGRARPDPDPEPQTALDDRVKQRQISLAVEYAARTRTR